MMGENEKGTSIWIPADVARQADEIVSYLKDQPGQYGAVTRSSVIRAALELFYRELGLNKSGDGD